MSLKKPVIYALTASWEPFNPPLMPSVVEEHYDCLAPCRLSEHKIATYDTCDLITALLDPDILL